MLKKYNPAVYYSVIEKETGRKICDCGWERDAIMMVSYDPKNREYIKSTNHLMGPVVDIEIPKQLPTNEVVVRDEVEFAGDYEGPLYAPHPDLLKQQYDRDKYLPDTQLEPFIPDYHD